MNREDCEQMTANDITALTDSILPNGVGNITSHRLRLALEKIAKQAFEHGRVYALMSLMTVQDVADHFGISQPVAIRRIRERHERFGLGMRIGKNGWLVSRDELPALEPMKRGRPAKE